MIIVKDYYPFAVDLDTCVGSCNILNNLSNKECVPNKKIRFKSKGFQYGYRNKEIKNIKKTYIMQM